MRKFLVSIIGIIALVLVANAVYFGVAGNPFLTTDQQVSGDAAVEDETRPIVVEVEPDAENDAPETSMPFPDYGAQFTNLEIILNSEFNAATGSRPAWKMSNTDQLTTEEMIAVGRQFGFEGPLYQERIPDEMRHGIPMEDDIEGEAVDAEDSAESLEESDSESVSEVFPEEAFFNQSYSMIDGGRRLNFYGTNANFQNSAIGDPWGMPNFGDMLPAEERKQIAEAWLVERDLLPDSYVSRAEMEPVVTFFELIDGIKLNRPVATVSVNKEGEVVFVDYLVRFGIEEVGQFELISAENAFEHLQEDPNRFDFNYMPSEEMMFPDMNFPQPQNWQREYGEGELVTRSVWLQVYDAVDSGEQLILAENMQVTGSAEIIAGLLEAKNGNVVAIGTIVEVDGARQFDIVEFSTTATPQEAYLTGTIERADDGVYLNIAGGLRVLLPDAPDDLEDGVTVGVFGNGISDATEGPPVFDWRNIDLQMDYSQFEEGMAQDFGPASARELTINSVSLVYQAWYPRPQVMSASYYGGPPPETIVPMWQFSGTTDTDATIEFWVPAIDVSLITGN